MAMKLEGLPCHTSIHAAGTLIVNTKVADVAPMIKQESKELNATALDLHDAESQKLVKYDYLAINNLNIVRECQELTGEVFDVDFDKYDDEKIWDLICSRNTTGLFQIGSNTYKQRMHRLRPRTIEQLADCLALVRGPCIQSKLDEDYMQIREGKKDIELIHPIYDEITKDTNGILIYQEQIMHLCAALGLSLYDGYVVVKAGAKKKKAVLKEYEDKLWDLAKDKMDKKTFDYMFKLVLDSAKYSFNKSHATSYALLTYVTAYYKAKYPKEFYAATLTCMYTNKSGKTDERKMKLKVIQKECMKAGIKFLPLDVNKSEYKCTIEDDSIRLGFCCLANVSENAYNEIKKLLPLDLGNTDTIEKIYTNVNKRQCNTKALNSIIAIGALGDNVVELYEKLYYLSAKKKNPDPPKYSIYINKDVKELELYDSAEAIEEVLCNANFINNSCSDLKELKRNNDFVSGEAIITKVTKRKSKKGKQYAFVSLDTSEGSIEALLFNLDDYKKELKKNKKINFKGKTTDDDKIIINHIGA